MLAYVTAARMIQRQNTPQVADATYLAQEQIEKLRNQVWEGSPLLEPPPGGTLGQWQGGALSYLIGLGADPRRCFRVTAADCDQDGNPDQDGDGIPDADCYRAEVKVCWPDRTGCPC